MLLFTSADSSFLKKISKKSFMNTISASNSLDPDLGQFVCSQMLHVSAGDKNRR